MNSRNVSPKQQLEVHSYKETLGLWQCEVLVKTITPKLSFSEKILRNKRCFSPKRNNISAIQMIMGDNKGVNNRHMGL